MNLIDNEEYEYNSGWKKVVRENEDIKVKDEFKIQINILTEEINKLKKERVNELKTKNEGGESGHIDENKAETIDNIIKEQRELKMEVSQLNEKFEYISKTFNDYKRTVEGQIQLLIGIVDFLKEKSQSSEKKTRGVLNGILSKK